MILENIRKVREAVVKACLECGKDPESVEIMAVTKTVDSALVREAVASGLTLIGENKVQDIREKSGQGAYAGARLCLIGHLQTNKASWAVRLGCEAHSVDSPKIAKALSRFSLLYRSPGDPVRVLMEVNAARDPAKNGVLPEDAHALANTILSCEGLSLRGFMTVAPGDESAARATFRALRELRDALGDQGVPGDNLRTLSMGMTGDYALAIREGSTMIRLGTALFGPRRY